MNALMNHIFVHPETKQPFKEADNIRNQFKGIDDDLPNLTWPVKLPDEEQHSKDFYEGRANQYEDTLHLTFFTHSLDENEIRNGFINRLNLQKNSKVLEIACGTGRDSELIAGRLGAEGELHMQDISEDMMRICIEKLKSSPVSKSFCLSNAQYLPYPDNYFDAVYSFGAMGEFSNKRAVINEMVRVTKKGGKIVFGDESVPIWLRKTEYYKILLTTNPMFESEVPFDDMPVEARNVNLSWVIGSTFYILDFEVGEGEPTANFDYEIPGFRGGSYRTRYEGQLEGVSKEAKELAYKAAKAKGRSVHQWLDTLVKEAATKDLENSQ